MKSKNVFLLLIALLACGLFLLRDHFADAPVEQDPGDNPEEVQIEPKTASGSTSEITFPLLAEARPTDLIDMNLAFPESLEKLNGRRVSMIGFMAPFDSLEDMSRCMIVPSYVGCTFCSPPNLRQVVFVTQGGEDSSGQTYPFIEEPSYVTGTFRISLPESHHEGKKQGFVYSIEDAEVTIHTGEAPKRAPSHATPGGHTKGGNASHLIPMAPADLISEIAQILGQKPLQEITIERVSAQKFGEIVWDKLRTSYPKVSRDARTRAFNLLRLLPEDIDWLQILTGFELGRRAAISDVNGTRILVLDSITLDHPFVRLELVGAITDALLLQQIAGYEYADLSEIESNEDSLRAQKSLRLGIKKTVIRRYAISKGISPKVPPPAEFKPSVTVIGRDSMFDRWYSLPAFLGPFFVDFLVGPTGPLKGMELALKQPPTTMMEFLRPLWYEDTSLWERNPVPANFADQVMQTPPALTDVLGVGGLIPWLAQPNSSYVARTIAGQWAGDRWAVWQFPDDSAALLLETRWQDEASALRFRDAIPNHPYQWNFPHENGSSTVRILRGSSSEALNRMDPFAQ
tara:strand:+ start:3582 stop:5297 length:1716 start_codon:yes stop_codon:yes gene_type:complete